jgi:hypothetical protein
VGKNRPNVTFKIAFRSLIGAAICAALVLMNPLVASANDKPSGFWYGADGNGPAPSGTDMPTCGGYYGFYAGRVNTTDDTFMHTNYANQAQTNANNGHGIGEMAYGDLDGPHSYSGFNGSTSEATAWGEEQASAFANNWDAYIYDGLEEPSYPLVFADMESMDTGWYSSSDTGGYSNWQTLNRDVFNGFWSEIQDYTTPDGIEMEAAYYTNQEFFDTYMPSQTMPNTWQWEASWTYTGSISSSDCALNSFTAPDGFSPQSIFGQSTSSACFGFWQWANTSDGSQDWDQTDQNRLNSGDCPE